MSPALPPAVSVTGLGLFTPLGRGADASFEALCLGKSGIRQVPEGHALEDSIDIAGFAPALEASEVLPPAEGRLVDRFVLMALAAADDALTEAGIAPGRDADPERIAVVVSSGAGGLTTFEAQTQERVRRGRTAVSPFLLPGMLPNMAAARIAIKYGLRGYSSAITTACAAGAHSIAEGFRLIRHGDADVVVCGAAEAPLNPTSTLAFKHAKALAYGWEDPAAASRPFDQRRNGFVLGEGGAVLVLERAADADARGAAAWADLIGWGATTDAFRPTTPRPDGAGAAACMRRAIGSAGLSPSEIAHVNAHGTSTKLGDVAEAKAIREVFGAHAPAVNGTKSLTGHLLGGAGAAEAAFTCLAVAQQLIPPTHNLDKVGVDCELDHVRRTPRHAAIAAALSNSFAFGGQNVSLLFARPTTRRARSL